MILNEILGKNRMGCIQSTSHATHQPYHEPEYQTIERDGQEISIITTRESREAEAIQSLKNQARELKQQITDELLRNGEVVRPILNNAQQLYNDLCQRMRLGGDSPSHYEQRLLNIRSDLNAIDSVGSFSERYFDRTSYDQMHLSPRSEVSATDE